MRECSNCGLLYRNRTLPQSELDRYYAEIDFRKWAPGSESPTLRPGSPTGWKRARREIADYFPTERCALEILRALPKGSQILDFGCSSGRLLAPLCADYHCSGVEVNEAAAGEAAKKGITILANADLENPRLPKFDAIVLVDLFEHMPAPLDLLRRLLPLLAEGGLLVIVTGNGDARACRRDPAQFWYFRAIEHLCMLTRKHTKFICSTLGLRLEQWTELCHYDLALQEKVIQVLQNFVYWQFRGRTLLASSVLQYVPGMNRLKTASAAPAYTCSRDHVVIVLRK